MKIFKKVYPPKKNRNFFGGGIFIKCRLTQVSLNMFKPFFSINRDRITSGGGDPAPTSGVQFWRYPLLLLLDT